MVLQNNKDKRINATKKLIAESFIELSRKKPVEKITAQEIADNCGFSRKTFYKYFKDRYDLIDWIYWVRVGLTESIRGPETREETVARSKEWLSFFCDNYRLIYSAFQDDRPNSFRDSLYKFTHQIMVTQIQTLMQTEDLPDNIMRILEFHTRALTSNVEYWVVSGMKDMTLDQMSELVCDGMSAELQKLYWQDEK